MSPVWRHSLEVLRGGNVIKTEKGMLVDKDLGEGRMGSYRVLGVNVQVSKVKRIMGTDGGDDCVTM